MILALRGRQVSPQRVGAGGCSSCAPLQTFLSLTYLCHILHTGTQPYTHTLSLSFSLSLFGTNKEKKQKLVQHLSIFYLSGPTGYSRRGLQRLVSCRPRAHSYPTSGPNQDEKTPSSPGKSQRFKLPVGKISPLRAQLSPVPLCLHVWGRRAKVLGG